MSYVYPLMSRSNGAGGTANDGYRNLAVRSSEPQTRERLTPWSERDTLLALHKRYHQSGLPIAWSQLVENYVALKSSPYIITTTAEAEGLTGFIELFIGTLLGSRSPQYTRIQGSAAWHNATGEDKHYRNVQERFDTIRILEMLQEAADPGSMGKLYVLHLAHMTVAELELYRSMIGYTDEGKPKLIIPGRREETHPIIPPNVLMIASVERTTWEALPDELAQHAMTLELPSPQRAGLPAMSTYVPPVGVQRLWLGSTVHTLDAALERLWTILPTTPIGQFRPALELDVFRWRAGEPISHTEDNRQVIYVANSFDGDHHGLFDQHDPVRNVQMAIDSYTIQRLRWHCRSPQYAALLRDLQCHLDHDLVIVPQMVAA